MISYLHRTLVDFRSIEYQSIVGALEIGENDGSNATAGSIRAIGEVSSLDRANSFAEVILLEEGTPISPLVTLLKLEVSRELTTQRQKSLVIESMSPRQQRRTKPSKLTQEHQRTSSEY